MIFLEKEGRKMNIIIHNVPELDSKDRETRRKYLAVQAQSMLTLILLRLILVSVCNRPSLNSA